MIIQSTSPLDYKLYFDEELHKYYDDYDNQLTSVTTVIDKYVPKFDIELMARNCWKAGLKGNPKYKGLSIAQIKARWEKHKVNGLERGNEKHNFLETSVKHSSNYYKFHPRHESNNRRLYTIPEIINNNKYGELQLEEFIICGVKDKYPQIFAVIESLVKAGYRIYSEVGVYNVELLVTGLIDIIFIKGNKFIILDWKTNKAPIRFEAGYYEKNEFDELTDKFIFTDDKFEAPVNLPASVGYKYAIQLNTYAYLASQFGLELEKLILCQIREVKVNDIITEEVNISFYPIMLDVIAKMLVHHKAHKIQLKTNATLKF